MKKNICKACSATNEESNEFCTSCGEWIGFNVNNEENIPEESTLKSKQRVPQLKCSNCKVLNLPSQKLCKNCSEPLIKPLSEYGAMSIPKRSDVPGIRAVFILTLIVPIVALASFYYNNNISEEVIQEVSEISQSTTTITSTTIQNLLEKQYPISCTASSSYGNDNEGYGCQKLYDGTDSTWQDNGQACNDAELTFAFSNKIYIEFIVFQNIKESKSFTRNFKARDIEISTLENEDLINYELSNSNTSEWINVNKTTDSISIKVLSSYPSEEYSGSQPFEECAIQEITFYGRG